MQLTELNELVQEYELSMAVVGRTIEITDDTGFKTELAHADVCCEPLEAVRTVLENAYSLYVAETQLLLGSPNPRDDLDHFQDGAEMIPEDSDIDIEKVLSENLADDVDSGSNFEKMGNLD